MDNHKNGVVDDTGQNCSVSWGGGVEWRLRLVQKPLAHGR